MHQLPLELRLKIFEQAEAFSRRLHVDRNASQLAKVYKMKEIVHHEHEQFRNLRVTYSSIKLQLCEIDIQTRVCRDTVSCYFDYLWYNSWIFEECSYINGRRKVSLSTKSMLADVLYRDLDDGTSFCNILSS